MTFTHALRALAFFVMSSFKLELKKKGPAVSAVMVASARAGTAAEPEKRSFISAVGADAPGEASAAPRKLPVIPVAGFGAQASAASKPLAITTDSGQYSTNAAGKPGAEAGAAAAADTLEAAATRALLREYGMETGPRSNGEQLVISQSTSSAGTSASASLADMPPLEDVVDPAAARWGPVAATKLTQGSVDPALLAKLFNPQQKRVVSGGMDGQTQPLLASSRVGSSSRGGAAGELQQELARFAEDIDPLLRGPLSSRSTTLAATAAAPRAFAMDDDDEGVVGSRSDEPEEGSADPYARVHIEDFGAAMLRGMGVSEAAIEAATGSKGDGDDDAGGPGRGGQGFAGSAFRAPPPQRPKGLGLGATALTGGGSNTTTNTSNSSTGGSAKAAAAAANKARKFPGLVDGAVAVLGGPGAGAHAGALGLVTQTEGVPGLEKCRVRLLVPAPPQDSESNGSPTPADASGPVWRGFTSKDTTLLCFPKAAVTALAPQAGSGTLEAAIRAAVSAFGDPAPLLAVCQTTNAAAAGADEGAAAAAASAALAAYPDAGERLAFLAAVEAASKRRAAPSLTPAPAPAPALTPAPPQESAVPAPEAEDEVASSTSSSEVDGSGSAEAAPAATLFAAAEGADDDSDVAHAAASEAPTAAGNAQAAAREIERGHRSHPREERETDRHSRRERDRHRSRSRDRDRRDRHDRHERDRRSRSRSRDRRHHHRDHSQERRHRERSRERRRSRSPDRSHSIHTAPATRPWALPGIRVRIADERHPAFKQKATVVAVAAPPAGGRPGDALVTLALDAPGGGAAAAQQVSLPLRHLQTAVPKPGGTVRVLRGVYRGAHARLLARDGEAEEGTVQFTRAGTAEADVPIGAQLRLPLDDIAEYL